MGFGGFVFPKEKGICPAIFHLYACLFALKFVELVIPPNFHLVSSGHTNVS